MQLRALRFFGFTAATCGILVSPLRAVTTTENSQEPHGHWWKGASRVQPAASTKGDILIAKPSVRYSAGSGTLTIFAPRDTEIFCEQDAQGFVHLKAEGWECSSDPLSAHFEAALEHLSFTGLHALKMQSGKRLNVGNMAVTGDLSVEADSVRFTGRVQAKNLHLKTTDRVLVEASAQLSAKAGANGGSTVCETPILVNGGLFDVSGEHGGKISFSTKNIVQYGRLNADGALEGGAIEISYNGKYEETESARVSANSIGGRGGRITVTGGKETMLFTSGTIEATGREGGTVHLLGDRLKLAASHVDVSGDWMGGTVLVGGDKLGANPAVTNAGKALLNSYVSIVADARVSGPGGKIVVWSDGHSEVCGKLSARGGPQGGDGGYIETSGKGDLAYGAQADAAAPHGRSGTLLMDPKFIEIKSGGGAPTIGFSELVDPHAAPTGSNFGIRVLPLSTGNVVVTDPGDNAGGTEAGAIYLFNGKTGAVISTLIGATNTDTLGGADQGGFFAGADILNLGANAYVVSPAANTNKGALTYINGTTGTSGTVGSANSILGVTTGDFPVSTFSGPVPVATKLSTGNYVLWTSSFNSQRGFAMLLDGNTGLPPSAVAVAQPSTSNCIIGTNANDRVALSINDLKNGHYVVHDFNWVGGGTNSGAATFCSSTTATVGAVTKANSVVGPTVNDNFGLQTFILPNGNYLLYSNNFGQGGGFGTPKGAVTLCSGTTGRPVVGTSDGSIDATNTYMGNAGDQVGASSISQGITILSTGYYVITSPFAQTNKGAVAVGSPTAGVVGTLSTSNSLLGHTSGNGSTTFGDNIGNGSNFANSGSVLEVGNGNIVITSPSFSGFRGAVTWMNPATPVVGDSISTSNSLIGATGVTPGQADNNTEDKVGLGGVYSFQSYQVFNGVTNGATLTYKITNNNYVVMSPCWSGGGDGGFTISGKGAATWGNGNTGVFGNPSVSNSMIGATSGANAGDGVGNINGITILSNGNYVLHTNHFNGTKGAVTWCNGATGSVGVVDSTNSLVGVTSNQSVADGNNAFTALSNGNYLVGMPNYTLSGNNNTGAVFWGDGSTAGTRLVGTVDAANKITGAVANDNVGQIVRALNNGNGYVISTNFKNNGNTGAGAVTWINGTNGHDVTGGFNAVSATNSLVGSSASDSIGSSLNQGLILPSGNFLIGSPNWDNGGTMDAGALTFCKSDGTTVGPVGPGNSLVGSHASDMIGGSNLVIVLANGNWFVGHSRWNSFAGAITWGSGTTGVTGTVGAANSVIGTNSGGTQDQVGSFQFASFGSGNPIFDNPKILASGDIVTITGNWHNGSGTQVGAGTWISASTGQTTTGFGAITASNSVVGLTTTNANFGIEDVANGTFLVAFNQEGSGHVRLLTGTGPGGLLYANQPSSSVTLDPTFVQNVIGGGTDLVLQANDDITVTDPIVVSGSGAGKLTLQAGRSILINANITTNNGALVLTANDVLAAGVVDAQRDSGAGLITQAASTTIDTGTGTISAQVLDGAGKSNTTSGSLTLQTLKAKGGSLSNTGSTPNSDIAVATLLQISANMTANAPSVALVGADVGTHTLSVTGTVGFLASGQFTTQIGGVSSGLYGHISSTTGALLKSTVLNATITGGYVPTPGDTITLIDNQSASATLGTFSGLAEGATVTVSGSDFNISYVAGTGNDVVLAAALPFTPTITAATTLEDTQSTSGLVITENAGDGGATTNYLITGVTNGTLFKNDGVTPILINTFITKAEGMAGLKFTPSANLYSPASSFSVSVQAAVGTSNPGSLRGGTATAVVTVNPVPDTPTVTNASTTMNTQSTSGLVITRNAADGAEITNFKITNILNGTLFQNDGVTAIAAGTFITAAQGTAGLKFTPTNGFTGQGHFDVQASLNGTDAGLGGGVATATITVGTLNPTVTQVGTTATLNRQSGLFELTANVQNTTGATINGFRLAVNFSAYLAAYPSLKLYNASSSVGATPVYVDYPFPVAAGATISMKLEFYTSNRQFPNPFAPVLSVTTLSPSESSHTYVSGVAITTITKLPDKTILLEWNTVATHWYRVSYSSDMVNWFDSPTPLQAGANKMQWLDSGPPFTSISPADPSVISRFYIVNEIATP